MKIKIPIVALTPHGGGRVIVEIANSLAMRGDNVTVVVSNYRGSIPFDFDERVVIRKLGIKTSNKSLSLLFFLLLSPFYLARGMIIANYFLTVIPSWIAKIFFGARYVYLVQDVEERFFLKPQQAPLRMLCRWTYRRGGLIAANAYLASELQYFGDVLLTMNLGVSRAFFAPSVVGDVIKCHDVVYFLRRQPHKRLDRFDSILDTLNARGVSVLCISQDAELLDAYRGRVTALKPRNDLELIAGLDSAKILLLTSEHEGFALPPLEAMARGLPVVMYDCGGPAVYASHDDNAFIVTDESAVTAVGYILQLLDDSGRYICMSERARAAAQYFQLDRAIDEFTQYLDKYADLER